MQYDEKRVFRPKPIVPRPFAQSSSDTPQEGHEDHPPAAALHDAAVDATQPPASSIRPLPRSEYRQEYVEYPLAERSVGVGTEPAGLPRRAPLPASQQVDFAAAKKSEYTSEYVAPPIARQRSVAVGSPAPLREVVVDDAPRLSEYEQQYGWHGPLPGDRPPWPSVGTEVQEGDLDVLPPRPLLPPAPPPRSEYQERFEFVVPPPRPSRPVIASVATDTHDQPTGGTTAVPSWYYRHFDSTSEYSDQFKAKAALPTERKVIKKVCIQSVKFMNSS
jgi:hypothetical protein